jgi:two-component system LytT family response regulator
MKQIRTLLVDDEEIALRGMQLALRPESDIDIVGTCQDGAAAIAAIEDLRPDLVFLDINMPEVSGFDVIDAIGVDQMPQVVFVTAYDQHAVRAFDVHALDYVLKPVDPRRLQQALERVRKQHAQRPQGGPAADQLAISELVRVHINEALAEIRTSAAAWCRRLAIKQNGRTVLVDIEEVQRFESAGNYIEVHRFAAAENKVLLMRESLASLESRLDPSRMVRISRSTIVNVARVAEIQPMFNGDFVVIMKDKTVIDGSRRYRSALDSLLG